MPDVDLFGRPIYDPIRGEQLPLFHEPNPAPPVRVPGETVEDRRIARKFAHTPTAEMFPPVQPVGHRPTLGEQVRALLDARRIPYVDVREAQRALFHTRQTQILFHLVVYSESGSNWLLMIGEAGEANGRAMEEWQAIFGDGFRAVFAVERAAGIVFRTLDGERLDLTGLR